MNSSDVYEARQDLKSEKGETRVQKLFSLIENALSSIPEHEEEDKYISEDDYYSYPEAPKLRAAIFWCRYDLVNYYLNIGNRTKAVNCFNVMVREYNDNTVSDSDALLIENIHKLRNKLDTLYIELTSLRKLSKSGKYLEAYTSMKTLISNHSLLSSHKEQCGWILYRYIKSQIGVGSSLDLRKLLKQYFDLEFNEPSILHSSILSLAIRISKVAPDFRLVSFVKIWNLKNLRYEDKRSNHVGDKEYPPLVKQLLASIAPIITQEEYIFFKDRLTDYDLQKHTFYNGLHSGYLRMMYEHFNENNFTSMIDAFLEFHSKFTSCVWTESYGKMLILLQRLEDNQIPSNYVNVLPLLVPENIDESFWKKSIVDDKEFPSNIEKLLNKWLKFFFKAEVRIEDLNLSSNYDESSLFRLFDITLSKLPNAHFTLRNIGLFYTKVNLFDKAKVFLFKAAINLSSQYYIWNDIARCFKDDTAKCMIARAILVSNSEEYLLSLRLTLCKFFYNSKKFNLAKSELSIYEKHFKGTTIRSDVAKLKDSLTNYEIDINALKAEYIRLAQKADALVYATLETTEATLYDRWNTKDGTQMLSFTNGVDIFFNAKKAVLLGSNSIELGQNFMFFIEPKLNPANQIKVISGFNLNNDLWSSLPKEIAIIDYVDKSKEIAYAYTPQGGNVKVRFKSHNPPKKHEFIEGHLTVKLKKNNSAILSQSRRRFGLFRAKKPIEYFNKEFDLVNIQRLADSEGLAVRYPTVHAIIDNVNFQKKLYHYISASAVQGIIRFDETSTPFELGDTLKIRYYKKPAYDDKPNRYQHIEIMSSSVLPDKICKQSTGTLSLNGNRFGFVNDIYVHPRIIEQYNLSDYDTISYLAVMNKGKWSVIKIL